jgi:transcription elongation factor GreA
VISPVGPPPGRVEGPARRVAGDDGAGPRKAGLPQVGKEGRDVQKFPMTAEGLNRLQEELRHLKGDERPAVIRAIAEARAHGDLSENAEYHAARERQSFIEGRIAELESIIPSVEVIDTTKMSGDQVRFGAHVTVVDEETEDEKTYRIVGAYEADMKAGTISISSPLAKALIGKKVGDSVEVPAPGGSKVYEIAGVRFG